MTDLLNACQAPTQFPWYVANDPRNCHDIYHLLLAQPLADTGLPALLALPLRASGWHPPPFPMTYSAHRTDMHCLGVVASVEQAIGLQQHREACLEEAGRDERSVPCRVGYLGTLPSPPILWGPHPHSDQSDLTLELQGKSFFHGVRFSVQTTSLGNTA